MCAACSLFSVHIALAAKLRTGESPKSRARPRRHRPLEKRGQGANASVRAHLRECVVHTLFNADEQTLPSSFSRSKNSKRMGVSNVKPCHEAMCPPATHRRFVKQCCDPLSRRQVRGAGLQPGAGGGAPSTAAHAHCGKSKLTSAQLLAPAAHNRDERSARARDDDDEPRKEREAAVPIAGRGRAQSPSHVSAAR